MSKRRPRTDSHTVERALGGMTISAIREREKTNQIRREMSLDEFELQFQERIGGEAGPTAATADLVLSFDTPFQFSPGTRDSDLADPQYSVGIHLESGSGVMISAHVTSWTRDETDAVIGASVEVAAVAPGVSELIPYTAVVHLSFQGYAALSEDESELA